MAGCGGAGIELFPLRAALAVLPPEGRSHMGWLYRPTLYPLYRPGSGGEKLLNFC
jgi:hypothetical protein